MGLLQINGAAYAAPKYSSGGESGIRTHGTLLKYTAFRGQLLKPLGHLSVLKYITSKSSVSNSLQKLGVKTKIGYSRLAATIFVSFAKLVTFVKTKLLGNRIK